MKIVANNFDNKVKFDFEYFLKFVDVLLEHSYQRKGQMIINVLHEYKKNLYDKIKGTNLDCFYTKNTDIIHLEETINFLRQNWNHYD